MKSIDFTIGTPELSWDGFVIPVIRKGIHDRNLQLCMARGALSHLGAAKIAILRERLLSIVVQSLESLSAGNGPVKNPGLLVLRGRHVHDHDRWETVVVLAGEKMEVALSGNLLYDPTRNLWAYEDTDLTRIFAEVFEESAQTPRSGLRFEVLLDDEADRETLVGAISAMRNVLDVSIAPRDRLVVEETLANCLIDVYDEDQDDLPEELRDRPRDDDDDGDWAGIVDFTIGEPELHRRGFTIPAFRGGVHVRNLFFQFDDSSMGARGLRVRDRLLAIVTQSLESLIAGNGPVASPDLLILAGRHNGDHDCWETTVLLDGEKVFLSISGEHINDPTRNLCGGESKQMTARLVQIFEASSAKGRGGTRLAVVADEGADHQALAIAISMLRGVLDVSPVDERFEGLMETFMRVLTRGA